MRTTTGLRISAAAAGAVCALAILPVGANAAFDANHDAQCEGATSILGRGASFQRSAHLAWGAEMLADAPGGRQDVGFGRATTANGGCATFRMNVTNGQQVSYEPKGSGDGRKAFGASGKDGEKGVRNTSVHFGGADEPPTGPELAAANDGPTTNANDDAVLLTIPVAQSSVATVVQLPAGCAVPFADRKLSRQRLEGAFAASANYRTWGDIFPDISGTDCKTKPLTRVVRQDSSGTTFAFKNYLKVINAATKWGDLGNQEWPNKDVAPVVPGAVKGASSQLDALKARSTDGGIAYADLATARAKGFDHDLVAGSAATDPSDRTFWVTVERADGSYQSPALSDTPVNGAAAGSNCRETTYADPATGKLPAVTESWANVNANNSVADYPLCTLTYALVWRDMQKANAGIAAGATAYMQGQARAVKDYLGYILNVGGGQAALESNGYQGLPTVTPAGAAAPGSMLAVAQAAQDTLTWNGAKIVTPPPTPVDETPAPVQTPPVVTPPVATPPAVTPPAATPPAATPKPAPAAPAAKVTVAKAVGVKGRRIALAVSPSAAGKLTVSASTGSGKKRVTIGKGTLTVKKGGDLVVAITPSGAGKRALKPGKTVKVTFKVTFTATSGAKSTVTKTVKVKIKR